MDEDCGGGLYARPFYLYRGMFVGIGVQACNDIVEFIKLHEVATQFGNPGQSLEVADVVFAEGKYGVATTFKCAGVFQVFDAQIYPVFDRDYSQEFSCCQIMFGLFEDPGVGYGRASDHNAVTACVEHNFDILRGHNIPVTNQGDRNGFLDTFKPGPVSKPSVGL